MSSKRRYRGEDPKKRKPILRNMTDRAVGSEIKDSFMDNYEQELLTTCSIIDLMSLHDKTSIIIKFDKKFLRKILKSHLSHIRAINADRT